MISFPKFTPYPVGTKVYKVRFNKNHIPIVLDIGIIWKRSGSRCHIYYFSGTYDTLDAYWITYGFYLLDEDFE